MREDPASLPALTRRLVGAVREASADELRYTVRAAALAPGVVALLALRGLDATLTVIDRMPSPSKGATGLAPALAERAVSRAFRLQPWLDARCLPRALVRYALARLDGEAVRFVVGVRRSDENVEAHAWVEPPLATETVGYEPLLTRQSP